jgi:hypothetical protein
LAFIELTRIKKALDQFEIGSKLFHLNTVYPTVLFATITLLSGSYICKNN